MGVFAIMPFRGHLLCTCQYSLTWSAVNSDGNVRETREQRLSVFGNSLDNRFYSAAQIASASPQLFRRPTMTLVTHVVARKSFAALSPALRLFGTTAPDDRAVDFCASRCCGTDRQHSPKSYPSIDKPPPLFSHYRQPASRLTVRGLRQASSEIGRVTA